MSNTDYENAYRDYQTASDQGSGFHNNGSLAALSSEDKNWAMACHLCLFAFFIVPLAAIIAPLVVWLCKRESSSYVDAHGKEALNFGISIFIYALVSAFLVFLVVGIFLLIALAIFNLINIIRGAVEASNGRPFRYPLCIRFVS